MIMRGIGFALMLGMPLSGLAQSMTVAPVGVAHVALRVSDLDREVNFLGKMGFEQAFANTDNGRTTQAFVKVNDRQFIEVYPQSAAGEAPGPLGLMHVCYEAADLKALNDGYAAGGMKPTSWRKAGAGNLLFNLQDPDGRVTEFTQYMPGSRQINDVGQHLGGSRVSDELLGFEMPVKDMKVAQKFYESMGFTAQKDGTNLLLGVAANPDVQIVLSPAHAGDRPQLLLAVNELRKAEDSLRHAGLSPVRNKNLIFVRDPDGNEFLLLESGKQKSRSLLPWKK
jgi:catechol 2,3-dioxygenase-like lactoylglutathione lyase family enzyme